MLRTRGTGVRRHGKSSICLSVCDVEEIGNFRGEDPSLTMRVD